MHDCLLGYSDIEGARYYGLGNEAMGLLVASALTAVALKWEKIGTLSRRICAVVLFALAALIGSPSAGVKFGGLIVATSTFLTFFITLRVKGWNIRHLVLVAVTVIAAAGAFAAFDMHRMAGSQSHFGQEISRISLGGVGEAVDLIIRKWSVEGKLLVHSAWTCPLWLGAACLIWLQRRGLPQRSRVEHAFVISGWVAVITCMLVNDAGAVAASLCIVTFWCYWITLNGSTLLGAKEQIVPTPQVSNATA